MPDAGITQVEKWLYLVQGWHLAWTGRPAFRERIEAWENGPVVAEHWADLQHQRGVPPPAPLDEEVQTAISYVVSRYGRLTARDLVDLTHDQAPWKDVYEPTTKNAIITHDALVAWFTSDPDDDELRRLAHEVGQRFELRRAAEATSVERSAEATDETEELERMLAELS
jgi:uncharacterized phage-associated protein